MSRRATVFVCLVSLLPLAVAGPARAATSTDYVALGDSYSAGVGAPGQSAPCLRSPQGYPGLWAKRNKPASFTNLACAGSSTSDVLTFQVPFVNRDTDLVSITIGGNDAGFAPAVISCTLSTDRACTKLVRSAQDHIRTALPRKLDATYRAIKVRAPSARVVVLSYPILFDTSTSWCGIGGMSLAKRRVLNEGARDLDDLIGNRARAAGFLFADVRGAFTGHGACGPSPWVNGLTPLPPTNSWHPNAAGYTRGYLPALTAALN